MVGGVWGCRVIFIFCFVLRPSFGFLSLGFRECYLKGSKRLLRGFKVCLEGSELRVYGLWGYVFKGLGYQGSNPKPKP